MIGQSYEMFQAFTRGRTFVALTNVGTKGETVRRTITYHPYSDGTVLCNVLFPGDCVTVINKAFEVVLLHGESKIFIAE